MDKVLIIVLIQILVNIALFAWLKARVRKELDGGSYLAKVRKEMAFLMQEMEGSADRNITILEDRIRQLKNTISEADRRISMSARENSRRKAENDLRQVLARDDYTPAMPDTIKVQAPKEELPFIRFTEKQIEIEPSFTDRVVKLYRQGFSSDLIAARLSSTVSEVELAIEILEAKSRNPED